MKLVTGIKLLAAVAAFTLAITAVHANLIENPGFEQDPGKLTEWAATSPYGTAVITTVDIDPDSVYSGSQAALLTVTGTGGFNLLTQAPDITPGVQYVLSFWLKAIPAPLSSTLVTVEGGSGLNKTFTPTESWASYSYVTDPLYVDPTSVLFKFSGPIGTKFYFDDVSFAAVPTPTIAVPETGTIVAALLLLLPFGASSLRIIRRNRVA